MNGRAFATSIEILANVLIAEHSFRAAPGFHHVFDVWSIEGRAGEEKFAVMLGAQMLLVFVSAGINQQTWAVGDGDIEQRFVAPLSFVDLVGVGVKVLYRMKRNAHDILRGRDIVALPGVDKARHRARRVAAPGMMNFFGIEEVVKVKGFQVLLRGERGFGAAQTGLRKTFGPPKRVVKVRVNVIGVPNGDSFISIIYSLLRAP
jgi:hypothetical protein